MLNFLHREAFFLGQTMSGATNKASFWKGALSGICVLLLTSCTHQPIPSDIIQARPLIYYHTVVDSNETLEKIAKTYDRSVEEICRMNHLSPNSMLVPGQRILILSSIDQVVRSSTSPSISVETSPSKFEEAVMATQKVEDADEAPVALPASPFIWPLKGRLLRRFRDKLPNGSTNEGINISAPQNVTVKAVADGTVVDTGELVVGFGKMVLLKHKNGMISIYAHLQEISVAAPKQGQTVQVKQGQTIGRVGKTGNVRVPQLHFQLRNTKMDPVNPLKYLPSEETSRASDEYLP